MQSARLQPLHAVARAREDEAVQRYVKRQEYLRGHEQKLAQLRAYLEDYCREAPRAQSAAQWRMRSDFIERLNGVIDLEAQVVAQARAACEAERTAWLDAHRDTEVLEKLAEKYRTQEVRTAEGRAQRETDEVAIASWVRARPQ